MTDSSTQQLPAGTLIKDRYKVVRLLGAGGMGAVYEASDLVLDKRVALKILHREIAQDPQITARFAQEARAASAFKHRNVVESLDFGAHEGAPFLIMEFLDGESFKDLLDRENKLTPERAVSLLEPIAKALAKAHSAGIVHRDVKPDNVYLAKGDDGECVPKLVDFGIAKRATEGELRLTKTSVAMGTPFYMPPEQAMGARDVTAAADQYAFAVMVYEAVSGTFPHDGESYNALIINKVTKEPVAITEAAPGIDAGFAAVVMKALAPKPEHRYGSIAELREALMASVGIKVDATLSITGSQGAVTPPREPIAPTMAARGADTLAARPSVVSVETASKVSLVADSVAGVERPAELQPEAKKPSSTPKLVGAAIAAMVLIGGVGFAMSRPSGQSTAASGGPTTGTQSPPPTVSAPARRTLRVRVTPATATIQIDGREMGRGSATFEGASGSELEVRLSAEGFETRVERLTLASDQSLERVLEALAVARTNEPQSAADAGVVAQGTGGSPSNAARNPTRNSGRNSGRTGVQLGRTGVSLDLSLTGGR
jgi:serine/threonine protein kinase